MTEPNSAKPSDPDPEHNPLSGEQSRDETESNPGDADKSAESQKFKLKLKPLSPHLKSAHTVRDPSLPPRRERFEIPRAVPIDPEPELAPHERPPDYAPPSDHPAGITGESPTPPPPQAVVPVEEHDPSSPEEAEASEPDTVELVTATKKRPNYFLRIGLPVIVLAGIAYLLNVLLDPFGLQIEPISDQRPTLAGNASSGTIQEEIAQNMAPVILSMEMEEMSIESYFAQLEQQQITLSQNPKGVFIDSVFFREGDAVNPEFGLYLDKIATTGDTTTIQFSGPQNKIYTLSPR